MAESLAQGEAEQAKPFKIRFDRATIEGGDEKERFVETNIVEGIHFITLKQQTKAMRLMAKAFGLNMARFRPWAETDVVRYLTQARNSEIDRLIKTHRMSADPMAHVDNDADLSNRSRIAAFSGAEIANVIELVLPAFESDGKTVPSTTMKVVACPRRGQAIEVELSDDNMEWLLKASWHSWYGNKQKHDTDHLPPLREDGDCYWRVRNNCHKIECKWKDSLTNRWKYASRTVQVDVENRELLEQMVVEIEKKDDNRFADTPDGDDGSDQHLLEPEMSPTRAMLTLIKVRSPHPHQSLARHHP